MSASKLEIEMKEEMVWNCKAPTPLLQNFFPFPHTHHTLSYHILFFFPSDRYIIHLLQTLVHQQKEHSYSHLSFLPTQTSHVMTITCSLVNFGTASLIYDLTLTRPDISYAVYLVCQFMSVLRTTHYAVLFRSFCILRVHFFMVFNTPLTLLRSFELTLMLIGVVDALIITPLLGFVPFLGYLLFLGVVRSKLLLHALAPRPNNET